MVRRTFGSLDGDTLLDLLDILTCPLSSISNLLTDVGIPIDVDHPPSLLGEWIPPSMHCYLHQDFSMFDEKELVGIECGDPLNMGEEGDASFIYGRVVKLLHAEGQQAVGRVYEVDIGAKKIEKHASKIYKFSTSVITQTDTEGVDHTLDEDVIKGQITADLTCAYENLNVEDRNQIIKRIILKWQPVEGQGQEDFCKRILEFVAEEIKRLECQFNVRGHEAFQKFTLVLKYAKHRAKHHGGHIKQQRYNLEHNSEMKHFLKKTDFLFAITHNLHRNEPQPGQARRWFRQARADLMASRNDQEDTSSAYEWSLYKCHQAVEKALKAANYNTSSGKSQHLLYGHNLRALSANLNCEDEKLHQLIREVTNEIGDGLQLRYPDKLMFPEIPHDAYTSTTAKKLYSLAERTLQLIAELYHLE